MKTVRLIISGLVQGVGYRYWISQKAKQLGICGFVRNREDGAVELVAVGKEMVLGRLIAYIKQGPPSARVDDVSQVWESSVEPFNEFQIIK